MDALPLGLQLDLQNSGASRYLHQELVTKFQSVLRRSWIPTAWEGTRFKHRPSEITKYIGLISFLGLTKVFK